MPFKQGKRPSLTASKSKLKEFRGALFSAGYELHSGPRVTRDNEIQAWVRLIGRARQVHVQEVRRRNGNIAVFAHTEPEGTSLAHALSALLDGASFPGGGKVLLNDLRAVGWRT